VFQPCDVGIQRIMKHSLKRLCHRDIVDEILTQVDNDVSESNITVDKTVSILRDHTVSWLWDVYMTLKEPRIVKKVNNALTASKIRIW
jgi:hypothetical protein